MFINRIMLKKDSHRNNKFWQMVNDEYTLHQAVWDLFGDNPDRKRDFIYRLETIGKLSIVYAVSQRRPVDSNGIWDVEVKDYDPKIKSGMRLGFTVRVNPTRKREGKRHDVVMDLKYKNRLEDSEERKKASLAELVTETCVDWLKERSKKSGFDILSVRVDGYRQSRFFKKKDGSSIHYSTVDFTGALQVKDEQPFKNTLFDGLGPEKGFGCGLMLVRKIS